MRYLKNDRNMNELKTALSSTFWIWLLIFCITMIFLLMPNVKLVVAPNIVGNSLAHLINSTLLLSKLLLENCFRVLFVVVVFLLLQRNVTVLLEISNNLCHTCSMFGKVCIKTPFLPFVTAYNQHKHIRPQKKIDSIRTLRMSLWKRQKRMILSELLTEVVPRKELDRSLPSSTIFLSLEIFNTWSLCWMYRIIKCLNFLLLCKHIQTSTLENECFAFGENCFYIKVGFCIIIISSFCLLRKVVRLHHLTLL